VEFLMNNERQNRFGRTLLIALGLFLASCNPSLAGPYAPAAGQPGSTAISKDDARIKAWAVDWQNYDVGTDVDGTWQTPERALGPSQGTAIDIVALGRGGEITLIFDPPIGNGPGWDFAIFENSFSDRFLELGYVEVSTNGIDFFRFENDSLTAIPVGGFGFTDPTNVTGFGGKYRQAYGTPFDLSELAGVSPLLDLKNIPYVKIIDIIGNGTYLDTSGDVIYDPYPSFGSAGFDLDAIGLIWTCDNLFSPATPDLETPEDGETDVSLTPTPQTGPFIDDDNPECEFHLQTRWQISTDTSFSGNSLVLDALSAENLTEISISGALLSPGTTYYWRAQHIDSGNEPSPFSNVYAFTTSSVNPDTNPPPNGNGIPDDQEVIDDSDLGLLPDRPISDTYKMLETVTGDGPIAVELDSSSGTDHIQYVESIDPATLPDSPEGGKPDIFPMGVMNFRVKVPPAAVAEVTLHFSNKLPTTYRWYKFHPRNGWYPLPDDVASFSPDGKSLTLSIKDGGPHDADGAVNGIVLDSGGVGSMGTASIPESGSSGIEGGCFIATAAYGSTTDRQVALFKDFRDRHLLSWQSGRAVVNTYYRYSPPLADAIARHDGARRVVRILLLPVAALCYLVMRWSLWHTVFSVIILIGVAGILHIGLSQRSTASQR